MEALICPQCGGQITDYSPNQSFVTCGYCSTKVLINSAKPAPVKQVDGPSAGLYSGFGPECSAAGDLYCHRGGRIDIRRCLSNCLVEQPP